jgi:hypothetical protein
VISVLREAPCRQRKSVFDAVYIEELPTSAEVHDKSVDSARSGDVAANNKVRAALELEFQPRARFLAPSSNLISYCQSPPLGSDSTFLQSYCNTTDVIAVARNGITSVWQVARALRRVIA